MSINSSPDLKTLLQSVPLIITHVDADFRVLHQINAANSRLHTSVSERFLADHHEHLQKGALQGETFAFDTFTSLDEGIWYTHHVSPLPNSDGWVISSSDITQQKQAAEAAQKKAHFLGRLLDTIDAGVKVFNYELNETTYANKYLHMLSGNEPSEGMPEPRYLDNIHPDDLEDVLNYTTVKVCELRDDEVGTCEFRILDRDGNVRWLAVRDVVLSRDDEGRVLERLGVGVDITERKSLEEELTRVNRWFEAIMNNSADAIAISTIGATYDDSKFITGNRRLEVLTGYTTEELTTMRPSQLIGDDKRPILGRRRRRRTEEYSGVAEGIGKRKDGTEFPFERLAVATPENEFISFVRDITARKKHEQELIDARLRAETALRARDVFIANMSHELRSPLNTIQGHVQLILDNPNVSPDTAEHLRHIDFSAQYLSRLIGDVLDISRVEAGFDMLQPVAFNPRSLLARLRGMLSVQARTKGLKLDFHVAEDVPSALQLDEVKLKQIIINLADNAIKYTQSGSISVSLGSLTGSRVRCIVRDTGPGMNDVQRLVEPYERSPDANAFARGSGLGLAITRRLVDVMGGEFTIVSDPDQGTEVIVDLPYEPAYIDADNSPIKIRVQVDQDYDILIVDDQESDRCVLEAFFEQSGFNVVSASDGSAALDLLSKDVPDLICMDLRMPGEDGCSTVARIRERGIKVPVIAITADVLPENETRLLESGCNSVVFKPYRLDHISTLVAEHLGIRLDVQTLIPLRSYPPLAVDDLAGLPRDWLQRMVKVCLAGDHEEAAQHVREIEVQHGMISIRLSEMIRQYWTTQIADLIMPLLN